MSHHQNSCTLKHDSRTFQVKFTCKKCKRKCFNVFCRIAKVKSILWIRRLVKGYVKQERLFCRSNHERNQQLLLSEGTTLSLEKAFNIPLAYESSISQTAVIQNRYMNSKTETPILKVSDNEVKKCYRCEKKSRGHVTIKIYARCIQAKFVVEQSLS